MPKTAVVTGVSGQDGSYLAEFLMYKGYRVVGVKRRTSSGVDDRYRHLLDKHPYPGSFELVDGDVGDASTFAQIFKKYEVDEFYHLAAQSHVGDSWHQPEATLQTNLMGGVSLLNMLPRNTRLFFAATSEMFGNSPPPQSEETPMLPNSPYAIAKLAMFQMCKAYRSGKGVWVSCGITFNHESCRRGDNFVTQKIVKQVNEIKNYDRKSLELGNLTAKRDWGWAPEYVIGFWSCLQTELPDDYVFATGETHTVKEFVSEAWVAAGLPGEPVVISTAGNMRPQEVNALCGFAAKAKRVLGWRPHTRFSGLVEEMVNNYGIVDAMDCAEWASLENKVLPKEGVQVLEEI